MPHVGKMLYDGLFLLSPAAAGDISAAKGFVQGVIERHGGEVETIRRWDDRRLAYPINNQRRGTFILTYFRAEGPAIAQIEREMKLSDDVSRTLIVRGDHIGDEELEAEREEVGASAARDAERAAAAAAGEAEDAEPTTDDADADSDSDEEETDEDE